MQTIIKNFDGGCAEKLRFQRLRDLEGSGRFRRMPRWSWRNERLQLAVCFGLQSLAEE